MQTHDKHAHRILTEIEAGEPISQRSLARRLGIALGLLFVHWLIVQSLVVIGALCPWCMVAWVATIAMLLYGRSMPTLSGMKSTAGTICHSMQRRPPARTA